MKWFGFAVGVVMLLLPRSSLAHVTVEPRESKPLVAEKYTVRVPSQGTSPTMRVELLVPDGVTVLNIGEVRDGHHEATRTGDVITKITWTKTIPLWQFADFVFVARNPAAGQLTWRSREYYADGRSAEWTSTTRIIPPPPAAEALRIEAWLKNYDTAFNAKDLEKLGTFHHPGATISDNDVFTNGWVAYRATQLGPELKTFKDLQLTHSDRQIHMLGDTAAYVVSNYTLKAQTNPGAREETGVETLILVKESDGNWRIRHRQRASRPAGVRGAGDPR